MAKSGIEKYTKRVEAYKKAHPNTSHKAAQKKISAEIKSGTVSGVKRKKPTRRRKSVGSVPRKRRAARRPATRKRSAVGGAPKYKVYHEVKRIGSVSYKGGTMRIGEANTLIRQDAKQMRHALDQQLAWGLLQYSQAKTKTDKRKQMKKNNEIKKKIRLIDNLS